MFDCLSICLTSLCMRNEICWCSVSKANAPNLIKFIYTARLSYKSMLFWFGCIYSNRWRCYAIPECYTMSIKIPVISVIKILGIYAMEFHQTYGTHIADRFLEQINQQLQIQIESIDDGESSSMVHQIHHVRYLLKIMLVHIWLFFYSTGSAAV